MHIRTLLLLLILFSYPFKSFTQSPNWLWARGSSGNSIDEGEAIAVDVHGNVYMTGFFQSSTSSFGSYTFNKPVTAGANIFLLKYDALGNLLWAKSPTSTGTCYSSGIALDTAGNIFITGTFEGTFAFDSDTLIDTHANAVFLAKYNPLGVEQWAIKSDAITAGSDLGNGVATDIAGNAYITGEFNSATFILGNDTLHKIGSLGVFVAKFDAAGNEVWAKSPKATGSCTGKAISVNSIGDVYVTGYFNAYTVIFGADTLVNPVSGADNVFLTRYNSSGNVVWAKSSNSGGTNYGWGVTSDKEGNSYITGVYSYSASVAFDTFILANSNTATSDIFVTKYDSSGNVLWAESINGYSNDRGYSIVTDSIGNVFVAGGYSASGFHPVSFGQKTLSPPPGSIDPAFVAKYDSHGVFQCAFGLSTGGDDVLAMAIDRSGVLYLGGDYMANPFILGEDTLPLDGGEDIFTVKFAFDCNITAVTELRMNGSILLYPNPTSNQLHVTTGGMEVSEINIYNVTGCLLLTVQSPANDYPADVTGFNDGIYIAEIKTKEGSVMKRWVKM